LVNIKENKIQSTKEEIANAVTHGIGAIASLIGTVILLVHTVIQKNMFGIISSIIFGSSLIILYAMSTLYHAITNKKAKVILQTFDHCSIFLLILGTYAPFCFLKLNRSTGLILFSINSVICVLGITLNIINTKRWHKLSLLFYILMGWSITFVAKNLISSVAVNGLILLLIGGLCYTLGIIFYLAKCRRYMHMIWHFFVLAGSVMHYLCILFYVV
jgi:hemolysin III